MHLGWTSVWIFIRSRYMLMEKNYNTGGTSVVVLSSMKSEVDTAMDVLSRRN